MHVTSETYHTLHMRKWESAQLCNEMNDLLDTAEKEGPEYPALHALFTALDAISGMDTSTEILEEEDIANPTYTEDQE